MRTKYKYTILTFTIIIAFLGMAFGLFGQKVADKKYELTEVQHLRLHTTQLEAQNLQLQLQTIQRQFQDKVSQLMQEANKVKLENGWSPDTQFNPDSLAFSAPPTKEEKK